MMAVSSFLISSLLLSPLLFSSLLTVVSDHVGYKSVSVLPPTLIYAIPTSPSLHFFFNYFNLFYSIQLSFYRQVLSLCLSLSPTPSLFISLSLSLLSLLSLLPFLFLCLLGVQWPILHRNCLPPTMLGQVLRGYWRRLDTGEKVVGPVSD